MKAIHLGWFIKYYEVFVFISNNYLLIMELMFDIIKNRKACKART